jgi:hypothetical protein
MKIRVLSAAIAMSLLSSVALAETHSAEIGLGVDHFRAGGDSTNHYTVDGTFYFSPVDDSHGPREEAAFLSKASSVSLEYTDYQHGDELYGIGGRVVLSNDYILQAGYSRDNGENTYNIGAGLYLTDHSDLVFSYERESDSKTNIFGAVYRAEQHLENAASLGYEAGAHYHDASGHSGYELEAGATYYFNHDFGLGAELGYEDDGDSNATKLGVHGSYFFTPAFYVRAGYAHVNADGGENEFSVRAALRF